ncbi:MAG: hypothetical protein ABI700_01600 [Chloroflexota bacterium]
MTKTHGSEVQGLIISYYMTSGAFNAQRDPNIFSTVATGPLLKAWLSIEMPTSTTSFYVTHSATIKEVHILEYTPERIKAVGCGHIDQDVVDSNGSYIRSLPSLTIMNIFVFISEDKKWKLYTMYPFGDSESALRDWSYVSPEEKQAIGDLQMYINTYSTCGLTS